MSSEDAPERSERTPLNKSDALLANVAILYYKDGLTQNDIAKRLGVSRPTVVAYLRQARELNIVDIRINGASFTVSNLSREIKDAFDLKDVYLASVFPTEDESIEAIDVMRHVARAGAMAVYDLLQPGDVLGVAWGQTIQCLAEEMPRGIIRNVKICQMIGSMKSRNLPAPETSSIRIAANLGADCFTLHAPAVLSSVEITDALKREPLIRSQLENFSILTKTLFSVGNCELDTQIVKSGIATTEQIGWYKEHGAAAVICGRFIDAIGEQVVGELDSRMIGITPAELKAVGDGILVASGLPKVEAMLAALRGGYVSYLVTDEPTGQKLLSQR
ncbi:MAG: sugar-binding transcriptional regulator [Ancalomicrobiaceae bacterium]|nr:sugar-binding transcriptional regulator [Ancalomicrobiaceae bacterium]